MQVSIEKPSNLSFCKFGFCSLFVAIFDLDLELTVLAPFPQTLHILAIMNNNSMLFNDGQ